MSKRLTRRAAPLPTGAPAGRTLRPAFRGRASRLLFPLLLGPLLVLSPSGAALAQGVEHILFGDVKVEEKETEGPRPLAFEVLLYSISGGMLGRQTVPNNGRYRFMNLSNGHYDVVVEVENQEVARVRVFVFSRYKTDFRQDLYLSWRTDFPGGKMVKAQTVSAADFYKRAPANQSLFEKAQQATDKKKYDQADSLLRQLLAADPRDFQGWTELGTLQLMQDRAAEAEQSYRRALAERPAFSLALLNLGRLLMSQKKYDVAVEPLARAVQVQPTSPDANHLLGEAYLQIRKGSKAVVYLNEALRLDPVGEADAHLRLAALYHGAGLKDRAAAEYVQFLKKRPDHPDRKKLEHYISENRKK